MRDITPLSSFPHPGPFTPPFELLHIQIEELLKTLIFAENHPEVFENTQRFEKISELLLAFLRFSQYGIIDKKSEEKVIEELKYLRENLKREDLYEKLLTLLLRIAEKNPKTKVVLNLNDLEYLLYIYPHEEISANLINRFQKALEPIFQLLSQPLPSIALTHLNREINLLRKSLPRGLSSSLSEEQIRWVLDRLENLGKHLPRFRG